MRQVTRHQYRVTPSLYERQQLITWEEAERRFIEADRSKPEEHRFKGWTAAQNQAHELWETLENNRMLLFYPTGTGKTKTSLALAATLGLPKVVVLAPPKTQASWKQDAKVLGLDAILMSIQKFRQDGVKLPKNTPIIVDEFHQTGKHGGPAFKKLERMARHFPGIILASATPQYNDADRVYCVAKILDTDNNMGGYLNWIQTRCMTRPNPFATMPIVEHLIGYDTEDGAARWLVDQGYTAYIEDTAEWDQTDLFLKSDWDPEVFERIGYDATQHKIMASQMEASHRETYLLRVNEQGFIRETLLEQIAHLFEEAKPWLIFCHHETIAQALALSLGFSRETFIITGKQSEKEVAQNKALFLKSQDPNRVLIGTTALATGVDGIDKVCDRLLIFDDIIGDPSMRRQLIGRVLPRGNYHRETRVVTIHVHTGVNF